MAFWQINLSNILWGTWSQHLHETKTPDGRSLGTEAACSVYICEIPDMDPRVVLKVCKQTNKTTVELVMDITCSVKISCKVNWTSISMETIQVHVKTDQYKLRSPNDDYELRSFFVTS